MTIKKIVARRERLVNKHAKMQKAQDLLFDEIRALTEDIKRRETKEAKCALGAPESPKSVAARQKMVEAANRLLNPIIEKLQELDDDTSLWEHLSDATTLTIADAREILKGEQIPVLELGYNTLEDTRVGILDIDDDNITARDEMDPFGIQLRTENCEYEDSSETVGEEHYRRIDNKTLGALKSFLQVHGVST